jgi:hypothetical protein
LKAKINQTLVEGDRRDGFLRVRVYIEGEKRGASASVSTCGKINIRGEEGM